jgi:type II secretory ATPase GspE/PulE/Tfp pilus assembly ATPase PilB-like protein
VPDLGNLPVDQILYTGLGVALWAYFFIFCVGRSRAAGVAYSEPPLALYGSAIKAIRLITLVLFAGAGFVFASEKSFLSLLIERGGGLALSGGPGFLVGFALYGMLAIYRMWKSRQDTVIYEPMPKGPTLGWLLAIIGGIGAVAAGPTLLESFFGMSANDLSARFQPGAFLAVLLTIVFFWLIPARVGHMLEDKEEETVWAHATGLELFRWSLAGLTVTALFGIFGVFPGLEDIASYPLPVPLGAGIPIVGAIIFGFFWYMPMRTLAKLASEGDFVAKENLPRVRFSGMVALSAYRKRAKAGSRRMQDGQKQLCPTCLRPTDDINAYHSFKFDHCPHCGSFIPPVFTMLDYVKNQSARIMPLVQSEPAEKGKKKKQRGEDESQLMQDLMRGLIAMTVQERGTDLHLGVEGEKFVVKCRTDGVLFPMMEFHKAMARPMISSLKVQANLDIAERRKPQDGRFRVDIGGSALDIRVNTSPVADGEMAALRLLYRQESTGSIYKLGMSFRNVNQLSKLIQHRNGLILVTGPTGSGKSTTLYNALEAIANGERNVVTLEDPIEVEVKGLTQMQVNANKGFTFANGLRTILRQDPDVIMIGEIRDGETAKMAIDAAATGHLVFTTLHATDSVGATGRLKDLGIDLTRASAVLLLSLAQRLVRMICTRCETEQIMTREELEKRGIRGFPDARATLKRGVGCPHCHESGFYGREGIYEFFIPDDLLKQLLAENQPIATIRQQARAHGMRTLLEDGLTKVVLGRTTIDEVLRVTT